jgi:glycosyltransferase involved in cell wall biosynthesis
MKKIPLRREFIRSQIKNLDGIFALHDEQKKEICQIYDVDEEKITVVGAGYNQTVFHRLEEIDKVQNKYRFIFAGKISEKKGVMSLIKSLSHLPWEPDQAEFVLAGGYGNQEEYDAIVEMAQNAPYKVTFAGKLTQTELAKEYNKSHVFILPSFSEGMPLTMIEAMSCGCKVVITDLPGIRPWVEQRIENPPVFFVEPPEMVNADEPIPESLVRFEQELAEKIQACAEYEMLKLPDLHLISWQNICEEVVANYVDNKSVYKL